MKKLLVFSIAVVLVFGFGLGCSAKKSGDPVVSEQQEQQQQPTETSEQEYVVSGSQKRVYVVAEYMRNNGYNVKEQISPEVQGELNGKPWPGVQIKKESDSFTDSGVFVPVSDEAVANGLCLDQAELIASLSKGRQSAIADCDEKSFAVSGFWATLEEGTYLEFKYRPRKTKPYKVVRVYRGGSEVHPSCTRTWMDEKTLEVPEGLLKAGETAEVVRQWSLPGGDGGGNITYQVMRIIKK